MKTLDNQPRKPLQTSRDPLPMITPQEAIRRARQWWNQTGRLLMKAAATTEETGGRTLTAPRMPLIKIAPETVPSTTSGILNAEPFDQLTAAEAVRVIRTWVKVHWQPQELNRKLFDPRNPLDYICQELEVTEGHFHDFMRRHRELNEHLGTVGGTPHRPAIITINQTSATRAGLSDSERRFKRH